MTIDTISAYISRSRSSEISVEDSVITKETIKAILSLGVPGLSSENAENENLDETAIDTFA